jgi:hypothetical protein
MMDRAATPCGVVVSEGGLSHLPCPEEGDDGEVVEQAVEPLEMAFARNHTGIVP